MVKYSKTRGCAQLPEDNEKEMMMMTSEAILLSYPQHFSSKCTLLGTEL